MRKRSIALVILLAAALVVVSWLVRRTQEPSYKGKPLSYWIDPWAQGGQETEVERSAALTALSERAVPYLVERLLWKPSPIMQRLYKRFPNFPLLMAYAQGRWDPYMANCHSSSDWQFKESAAMALPTVILKAGWLRCWAARFLPGRVAG
jgi:hypothetical protein